MVNVNDLKNGTVIEYDGKLCQIIEFMHVLQNKVAFTRVKLKDLRTGARIDTAFKGADQKFKLCNIERKAMQFIFSSAGSYTFMDSETYEQIEIPSSRLEWEINFLQEGMNCEVMMYEGEVLTISLPDKVNLRVHQCEPAVRGDTKTSALKDAFLESGFLVKVPMFVNQDEIIIVSTKTGEYCGRA